jgi:hypothetical protein
MASGSQADVEMEAPIWVLAYIAEPSLKALGFYELKRSQGLHIFDASQIPANVRNRPEVRKPAKVEQVYLMVRRAGLVCMCSSDTRRSSPSL